MFIISKVIYVVYIYRYEKFRVINIEYKQKEKILFPECDPVVLFSHDFINT